MSVDKWAYDPETCDGRACPGDCDRCDIPKNPEAYGAEAHGAGYVGIDKDYFVSVKDVLNITAETGAIETQSRVRELPHADVADILERSEIVGYTFKELCMFAEACRRQGIEEDDLKNFCTAANSAAEYTIDKIMEAFEKDALDQVTRATVDDDVMNESEDEQ